MTTRTRTNQDEIDALLDQTPGIEVRKAQMVGDLFLFAGRFGQEALDECYRRASEWLTRDEWKTRGEREQHEAPAPIEQWGRGDD